MIQECEDSIRFDSPSNIMSSHCADEDHNHDHGAHDHDHDDELSGRNLYSKIDIAHAFALNSEQPASNAIKPWHQRVDETLVRT